MRQLIFIWISQKVYNTVCTDLTLNKYITLNKTIVFPLSDNIVIVPTLLVIYLNTTQVKVPHLGNKYFSLSLLFPSSTILTFHHFFHNTYSTFDPLTPFHFLGENVVIRSDILYLKGLHIYTSHFPPVSEMFWPTSWLRRPV